MATNQSRIWKYREHVLANTARVGTDQADAGAVKKLIQNLGDALRHLAGFEDRVTTLFPEVSQGYVDEPLRTMKPQTPVTPPPSVISVQQRAGISFVTITPPNKQSPPTPALFQALIQANPNIAQAPITHQLQSSATDSFDSNENTITYGSTDQLFVSVPDGNANWRVSSSFDDVNFNEPTSAVKAIPV